mgnify:CR=1 FL=1
MCALGAGLSETGVLNPEGRVRALNALRRFQHLARGMDLPPLTVVATAAVREASDGPDFCEEVERETGLRIWVIDGEEEAAETVAAEPAAAQLVGRTGRDGCSIGKHRSAGVVVIVEKFLGVTRYKLSVIVCKKTL